MNRKQILLGSSAPAHPTLTMGWSPEKAAALETNLHTVKTLLDKPELTAAEVQWIARLLDELKLQVPRHSDVHKLAGVLGYRLGNHGAAEQHLRRAHELNPDDADNLTNLAATQRAQSKVDAARETLDAARDLEPRSPIVLRNLGNVYLDQGAYEAAAECYRQSLSQRRDHSDTWHNFSFALARARRLCDAIQATWEAESHGVDRLTMLNRVGGWLSGGGHGGEAVAFFAEALQIDDTARDHLFNMGVALMQAERKKDAHTFFDMVLEQNPDHVPTLIHKAQMALDKHDMKTARGYIERGLAKNGNVPALRVNFASVLFHEDDLDGAERQCWIALRIAPNAPGPYGMLAQIARTRGNFEASQHYAEKVIELAPQKGGPLSNYYASKKDITEEDDVASVLARLEAQQTTSKRDLTAYYYTLGELFHKLKSPERAIFFLKAGNDFRRIALKSEGQDYNRSRHEHVVDRHTEVFSREFFERNREAGLSSARPVFILGMPRSGTTLTEQIISSHPLVYGAGELSAMPDLIRKTTREAQLAGETIGFPGWAELFEQEKFAELAQGYLDRIAEYNADALRVTDKMPHNFQNVGLIASMFPNARIIHVMRDPVDNCLSCFQQNFAMPHTYSTNLGDVGHHYREYRRLMAHWREVVPTPIYEVQYEELVQDQERVSRELIAFCGLDWDDRCLEFNKKKGAVKTASVWQVRQPIYSDSVKKWKMYDGYIDELLDELNKGRY